MNVENILKVADAIEQHSIADLGFNMSMFASPAYAYEDLSGHNCGTTACIGGWAAAIMTGNNKAGQELPDDEIGRWMGIDPDEAADLFYAFDREDDMPFEEIPPSRAVAVLRHLAATGKVDWSIGAPSEPSP